MAWGDDLCQAAIQNLARAFVKTGWRQQQGDCDLYPCSDPLEEAEFDTAQERCRILQTAAAVSIRQSFWC